jgi:glycerol-3-phosphate dehydrogenase (NAD(P)+)
MIGSGSWGTALVKVLTAKGHALTWRVRHEDDCRHIRAEGRNPRYLADVPLDTRLLALTTDTADVLAACDIVVVAVPSAYVEETFAGLDAASWRARRVLSAVKGILPGHDRLLNEYLAERFGLPLDHYHTVMGPCHAEEVAAGKLSYLTFSGIDVAATERIAADLRTPYVNCIVNTDVVGVQYAAVLKNIYALGAGIAQGLGYGDNFLSVLIANCADEMAGFLRQAGIPNIEVGVHGEAQGPLHRKSLNYAASVYLGDLLVTCYSPYSRNRMFGRLIGLGHSVGAAHQEMSMVAEGHTACRGIHHVNRRLGADIPIAETVYRILWDELPAAEGVRLLEDILV